ncbi:MAG: twin arginine-targeting protein translocase TatB [Acidocella sp. 20-63-7]|nr:MAG: twin arginine-targeting protein translocase TatB [Acidocella sp. 20-63-7]HQT45994.1 Sec-independent protein translocase protein TatB [Acidocella sp.]
MFGFSWGEIGLIMAVALIAIGPKDLPVAIRTVTAMMKKARGMAAEFQGHVDDMMREANLSDVKTEINKLRRFDFKTAAEQAIDPDGSLREAVSVPPEFERPPGAERPVVATVPVVEELPDAPEFVPPDVARKQPVPAFIPPGTRRWGY